MEQIYTNTLNYLNDTNTIVFILTFLFFFRIIFSNESRKIIFENFIRFIFDCLTFLTKSLIICGFLIIGFSYLTSPTFAIEYNDTQSNSKTHNKLTVSIYNGEPIKLLSNNILDNVDFDNVNLVQHNLNDIKFDKFKSNITNQPNQPNQLKLDPNKKNLVIFRFDEVFTSRSSAEKFENINNFVNLVINSFEPIKENTEIAIILTSGGGNSLFFERAYANLQRLSKRGYKIYALIDTVCASGCYMMACACDTIIANNHSSIGSIGVYTKRYNGEKLGEKLGVNEIIFKTSKKKGDIPFFGPADKDSLDHINERINKTMDKFTKIVKKSRPKADLKHFDADVWYSDDALKYNMIDKIQMVDDFIKEKETTHNIIMIEEQPNKPKNTNSFFGSMMDLYEKISNVFELIESTNAILQLI